MNWWCLLEVATALLAAEEVDEPVTCFPAVSHQLLNMTHPRVQIRSGREWGRRKRKGEEREEGRRRGREREWGKKENRKECELDTMN